jgi:hypothetical protein
MEYKKWKMEKRIIKNGVPINSKCQMAALNPKSQRYETRIDETGGADNGVRVGLKFDI